MNLESSRLYYRELQQSDAEAMFAMECIPEVHRYLYDEIATDIQETHDVITYIRSQYTEEGIGRMATFLKDTDEFIGWTGLKLESSADSSKKFYDVGYQLLPKFWGRGYATEATLFFLDYAFNTLQAHEVNAYAHTTNAASIRVLEKCGLHPVQQFASDGRDMVWFSIKK
ncbi:GNAT family N-acetyltransferase [Flavobacterium sp. RHBU_24]|uniref:GNAT family N-acetyltransferase n=1 Tax=Flavobacterium sp. RHBU_24 TaxID=3391185 RepID=UPI003985020E